MASVSFVTPLRGPPYDDLMQVFVHSGEWNGRPFFQTLGGPQAPELALWCTGEAIETSGITIEAGWNVSLVSDWNQSLAWSSEDVPGGGPPESGWHIPPWSPSPTVLRCVPTPTPFEGSAGSASSGGAASCVSGGTAEASG